MAIKKEHVQISGHYILSTLVPDVS